MKELLRIVKRMARLGGTTRPSYVLHPERAWLFGLCIGIMLLVLGSVCASFVFVEAARYADEGSSLEASGSKKYNTNEVAQVLKLYEARRSAFEALRSKTPVAAPPETVVASSTESASAPAIPEDVAGDGVLQVE